MEKHYQDVDFRKNQLVNILLHPVQVFPSSPKNGQVVFREDQGVFYWYELATTTWKPLGNTVIESPAPSGIDLQQDPSTGKYTIKVKIDPAFFLFDPTQNTLQLKDAGVTTGKLADAAVKTAKIEDKAVTFAKIQDMTNMTLLGRTSGTDGTPEEVVMDNDPAMVGNSPTSTVTQAAVVAYVNSTLGTFGGYVGPYNPSSGNFPVRVTGNLVGNMWNISADGTIQGIGVTTGDVLIARVNGASATNPADWIILQGNLTDASETVKGYIRIATTAEVSAGIDDTTTVTPLKLSQALATPGPRYTTNVGDGIATEFTLNHALNAAVPMVLMFDTVNNQIMYAGVEVLDPDNVKITFSSPPSTNRFTVIIKPF